MDMTGIYLIGGFLCLAAVYCYIFPTQPPAEMTTEEFNAKLKANLHD